MGCGHLNLISSSLSFGIVNSAAWWLTNSKPSSANLGCWPRYPSGSSGRPSDWDMVPVRILFRHWLTMTSRRRVVGEGIKGRMTEGKGVFWGKKSLLWSKTLWMPACTAFTPCLAFQRRAFIQRWNWCVGTLAKVRPIVELNLSGTRQFLNSSQLKKALAWRNCTHLQSPPPPASDLPLTGGGGGCRSKFHYIS